MEHLALVKGDLEAPGPVLVRVHAVRALADLLGIGAEAAKGSLIEKSMRAIAEEGRGVIVLIRDLRPKSVSEWMAQSAERKRSRKADDERRQVEIGIGSQILRDLGRQRHGAAVERAALALRRPGGVRAAHRRPAQDRMSQWPAGDRRRTRSAPRHGSPNGARILLIDAPYYENIAEALLAGAIAELEAAGATFERVVVPGALEIPLALAQAVEAGLIPGRRQQRPLRRLRGARLRHPRRDHATTTRCATTPTTG